MKKTKQHEKVNANIIDSGEPEADRVCNNCINYDRSKTFCRKNHQKRPADSSCSGQSPR